MSPEGGLLIRLELEQAALGLRVARTVVASTRPHIASRLFGGLPVADAVAMLPRLYSVCGRAQGIASALACEAATGIEAAPGSNEARRLLAGVESVQEGLRSTQIDWPRMLGDDPAAAELASARAALDEATAGIRACTAYAPPSADGAVVATASQRVRAAAGGALSRQVFGMPQREWESLASVPALAAWSGCRRTSAARLVDALQNADGALGASDAGFLPGSQGEAVARRIAAAMAADPEFERAPLWDGRPAETGPLARSLAHPLVAAVAAHRGRSALARFVARLVELCAFVSGWLPEIGGIGLGTGCGIGWVETSRGLLAHLVRVESGRVGGYRIVAPTDWNFHPGGPLPRALQGRAYAGDGALRRAVSVLVQSLDPCVAWSMATVVRAPDRVEAQHA